MNKPNVKLTIGLLLVTIAIILNFLKLENDLVDFLMGVLMALGLGLLIFGLINKKK